MALFGKKSDQTTTSESRPSRPAAMTSRGTHVLRHARITEKATDVSGFSVYTFDVATNATKRDIARAVSLIYKVTPRKVAIAQIPTKNVRSARTGKVGVKKGGKKAYVYLKKGETLTIS